MLAPLLLAAALASGDAANDARLADALGLIYDGSTDTALTRLAEFAAADPTDPMPLYLESLALCWKAEQDPGASSLDDAVHALADGAIATADARLAKDPRDARSLLARGAAWGVRSRLHLFRRQRGDAVRAAVAMRADLARAHALDPDDDDALFGLGLYDYYADVLPRLARILRFLAGYPGGDRTRGLARIERARAGSRFHRTEVEAQLYDIHAFYEGEADRALEIAVGLRNSHPRSPLWGLRLAEHLRERLGLYSWSVAVARELREAADRGEPNHAPVVGTLARIAEAEALALDLRFAEARQALDHLAVGNSVVVAPRIRAVLERCRSGESDPVQSALARGRRSREAGRLRESSVAYGEALRMAPRNAEARLREAEHDVDEGRIASAERQLRSLVVQGDVDPPWVRPWSRVLLARVLSASRREGEARQLYEAVRTRPGGIEELRREAVAALGILDSIQGRLAVPANPR